MSWLKSKLPSRNTVAFFSVVGTVFGLKYYDKHLSKSELAALTSRASVLANQPLDIDDYPRKMVVYCAPPSGDGPFVTREHFKDYVKPVLDAAAVDYEIKSGKLPGKIHQMVCESIKEKRRKMIREQVEGKRAEETEKTKKLDENDKDAVLWGMGGILAVGRISYAEVLNGISEGCTAPLNKPRPVEQAPAEVSTEMTSDEATETPAATESAPQPTTPATPETPATPAMPAAVQEEEEWFDYDAHDTHTLPEIPPIGVVPFTNIIGWLRIPHHIWNWYNLNTRVKEVGEATIPIAFEKTRPYNRVLDEMESLGEEMSRVGGGGSMRCTLPIVVDSEVAEKVRIYALDGEQSDYFN